MIGDVLREGDFIRADALLAEPDLDPRALPRRLPSGTTRECLVSELYLHRARLAMQRAHAGEALQALKLAERARPHPSVAARAASIRSLVFFMGGQVEDAVRAARIAEKGLAIAAAEFGQRIELEMLTDAIGVLVFVRDLEGATARVQRVLDLSEHLDDRVMHDLAMLRLASIRSACGAESEVERILAALENGSGARLVVASLHRRRLDLPLRRRRYDETTLRDLVAAWRRAWQVRQRHELRVLLGIMRDLEGAGLDPAEDKQIAAQLAWLHVQELGTTPFRCVRGPHRGTEATMQCLLDARWAGLSFTPRATWTPTYERNRK
jgi:hypothetical protein